MKDDGKVEVQKSEDGGKHFKGFKSLLFFVEVFLFKILMFDMVLRLRQRTHNLEVVTSNTFIVPYTGWNVSQD